MRKSAVLFIAFIFSFSAQAEFTFLDGLRNSFADTFGTTSYKVERGVMQPSTGCIKLIEKSGWKVDEHRTESCNMITTFLQFQCVKTVMKYSRMYENSIKACSSFEDELSLNAFDVYTGSINPAKMYATPNAYTVLLFAGINNAREEACVINYLNLGQFSRNNVEEKCIEDEDVELDKREYDALGSVYRARTFEYGLRDFGNFVLEAAKDVID